MPATAFATWLGALANNGGNSSTHLPAVGSPLVNAIPLSSGVCAIGEVVDAIVAKVTARTLASIEARVLEIAEAKAVPALVGGDHTVTLGALRAIAKVHGPVGLIHFDAHSDTYGPAWGVDTHHGTVFRNAVEEGLLRPHDVIQVGLRGPFGSKDDLTYARDKGFTLVSAEQVHRERRRAAYAAAPDAPAQVGSVGWAVSTGET